MNITALLAIIPVVLAVALIIAVVRRNITENPGGKIDITPVIPAVVVLMVALLVIGSVSDVVEDRDFEIYDCVPLADFGSQATISGDSAEVVSIDGKDYVRMTSIGTFKATYPGGTEKEYTVSEASMDLVLLTGQSNSYFYTNPQYYESDCPVAPGKAFFFGTDQAVGTDERFAGIPMINVSGSLDVAGVTDIAASDGSVNIAAMYPEFCAGYVQETGHRVIVVNTGVGGRGIASWDQGEECDVWMEEVLERFAEVVDGKIALTPVAVLWSQGESDYQNTEEYYEGKFRSLVERFEGGEWVYEFPRVSTVLPRHDGVATEIPPALAQEAVAESDSTVTVASTLALRFGARATDYTHDMTHYTQEVYSWFGEAFAIDLAKALGRYPVKETIVMTEDVDSSLPSSIDAYGTSGKTYRLSVSWRLAGNEWTGRLYGNPSSTTIADGLDLDVVVYSYDPATKTLLVNLDSSRYDWGDAVNAENLIISEGVTKVAANQFSRFSAIRYIDIEATLSSVGSNAFPTLKDYLGQTVSAVPGEYAGLGDGTLYLCDPTLFTYSGRAITGVTAGFASAQYVVIPSSHNGTTITGFSAGIFANNASLKTVLYLPGNEITTLGSSGTFRDCPQLSILEIPDGVTYFGPNIASGCPIQNLKIPEGATEFRANAFNGNATASLAIPDSVTVIAGNAFKSTTLASLTIGAGVTSIGADAFSGTAITSVSFADGFAASTLDAAWNPWTFYGADGTTVLDKTIASNLAGHTFTGTASALVMQS